MKTSPMKLLVIVGVLLLAAGSAAGLDIIHVPASEDARTLFSGAMLLYWAFVFFVASRDSGYWTRFPARQRDARYLAIGLGVLGAVLALMGIGLIG
jgi:uncharacterized membrane protein HdeD (DUF308 family)